MEEVLSSWFMTAIDVVISSSIIVSIVVVLTMSSGLNEKITEQQAMTAQMEDYREHNQFDGTVVYPQDIVSAIYRYRGSPAVYVSSDKGHYEWTEGSAPCPWNTAAISNLIDQTKMYDASLVYGGNGEVVAYQFIKK